MRYTVKQFARESVGLCPLRGSFVREFELSHSNPVNRIIKITHAHCTQFAREGVGLCPFYNSYVKQELWERTLRRRGCGLIVNAEE